MLISRNRKFKLVNHNKNTHDVFYWGYFSKAKSKFARWRPLHVHAILCPDLRYHVCLLERYALSDPRFLYSSAPWWPIFVFIVFGLSVRVSGSVFSTTMLYMSVRFLKLRQIVQCCCCQILAKDNRKIWFFQMASNCRDCWGWCKICACLGFWCWHCVKW